LYQLIKQHYYKWLPWLFLVVALPLTFSIWQGQRHEVFLKQQSVFDNAVENAKESVLNELKAYEQILIGFQSFFGASNFVNESEFNRYSQLLVVSKKPAGLKQIGFARYLDGEIGDNKVFAELLENVAPLEPNQVYAPIVYLNDEDSELSPKLFSDVFKDKANMQLMLKAAERNVVIAAPIPLSQNNQDCVCFTLITPIYKSVNDLLEFSFKQIEGWAFVNLNQQVFFKHALKSFSSENFSFKIYSDQRPLQGALNTPVYQEASTHNHDAKFKRSYQIELLGQYWLISAKSEPAFERAIDYSSANNIGTLGLLTSFAVFGILQLLILRLRNLNEMQSVNNKLLESERRWQFAVEGAGDGVWDWNIEANKVVYSKRWKEMLGFEEDDIGESPDEWRSRVHPDDFASVVQAMEATLKGISQMYAIEYKMRCKDGNYKWVLDRGMVVNRDANKRAVRMVGTQADISSLKESEEVIWQHANFDMLTGLPNRRMFYARLDQEIQKARRSGLKVALLFLDLDGFKGVNDTLGHDQGDVLLKIVATRLVESMRGSDGVARLGGDEFVITVGDVANVELKAVESIASKILRVIAEPVQLTYETAYVSASIGIVIYPDDAMNIEDLMKNVDQAMYASKQKGGNCFSYFTPRMQEVALNRMQLSNDLRLALGRKEFYLEYQPIVDLKTGAVKKAEALLRWQHPKRGLIGPCEFIPVAEETRLINDIGNWVYEQAITDGLHWKTLFGNGFQVSVNSSPVQFNQDDVNAQQWLSTIKQHQDAGNLLVVEITEGLLLDANNRVKEQLEKLEEMGVEVAIDDFGTGYSSLSYLKKFAIHYLKIDKSFVTHLTQGSDDLALCKAIIVMAHSLGLKVIAEGIETEEQKMLLTRIGCDFGQGYYFAKPLKSKAFEAFALANQSVS
jgi:diguanylate cyclase (GGDEF)-like protein/PAS domain S-box-containing protein